MWVEVIRPQSAVGFQLDRRIEQVAETNDELACALMRLKHSFELLLAGQKTPETNSVLAQADRFAGRTEGKECSPGSLPRKSAQRSPGAPSRQSFGRGFGGAVLETFVLEFSLSK
jgi:hypothetical protein